jgi:hypothetical protein
MEATAEKGLKLSESRPGLVIRRLLQGREEWKRKCRAAKDALQDQRVRIRDLEASREHWRGVAERAEQEKRHGELELAKLRQAVAEHPAVSQKK